MNSLQGNEFANIEFMDKLESHKARHATFSVYCPERDQYCALKIFPIHQNGQISHSYLNETRFCNLDHPCFFTVYNINDEQKSKCGNKEGNFSCILKELSQYENLSDLIIKRKLFNDEKLIRYYFKQLVDAVEYLHYNNIAHTRMCLENIVLGLDFNLKITDFSEAFIKNDNHLRGQGAEGFRPPEMIEGKCKNPFAVDIYALGIILFSLKTGNAPYVEGVVGQGYDFAKLLWGDHKSFWKFHEKNLPEGVEFDMDFLELFKSMISKHTSKRATLQDIKESKWFNGPTYTPDEVRDIMFEVVLQA
eukprot:CAMPEP_0114586476 /NCGR_PEP_ID=MMETSP0125-20121206/9688_1 /TAXON_ID=485358 ORGANISM="Aristerostoma sp., Strain ATCC 50986" /NCGR_SAMPLE_ID=MMETSP0125 /ASSEMBLY_ACC=CAM_ASM_000245 /LENGTH=304 /DNA_ID=CAMNT_0001781929 /DNA_START=198 /DNA_END=1112 /DNA_ORIENTATION=+